jgi:hypothetical protein
LDVKDKTIIVNIMPTLVEAVILVMVVTPSLKSKRACPWLCLQSESVADPRNTTLVPKDPVNPSWIYLMSW